VENIEEELGRDGYRPDTLVGILRGGMIVADLLSDLLNIREVYVVGCKSYAGLSAGEVRLYHDLLLKDLGGRDVLLVDDVADTGSTLETAVEKILKPRNPRTVRTATLLIKPWSKSKPDYTAASTDAWVVFPWERMETVRAVGRMWAETLGFDRAAAELAEVSRLRPERVSRTLKELI
jgi:hypoxanthine phosphoribosyltransferase